MTASSGSPLPRRVSSALATAPCPLLLATITGRAARRAGRGTRCHAPSAPAGPASAAPAPVATPARRNVRRDSVMKRSSALLGRRQGGVGHARLIAFRDHAHRVEPHLVDTGGRA